MSPNTSPSAAADQPVIDRTIKFVQQRLQGAEGGHDWFHSRRVWQMARHLSAGLDCDRLVIELAALLHDIADAKFHSGDEELGPRLAEQFLNGQGVSPESVCHVVQIVRHISFKGGGSAGPIQSIEYQIVQDADRLDAIGAIGIARAFSYGGFKGRALYDPDIPPMANPTAEQYRASTAPTINHFYEKLLKLKDRMHTARARQIAESRHAFMLVYLDQFFSEFQGGA